MENYEPPEEWIPPEPQRVLRRAFALASVAYRAAMESSSGDPEPKRARVRLLDWLRQGDLLGELEPDELSSIVQERHTAAKWLLGQNRIYSEITTDT